jgi:E3 ubiquitin-protein ligase RNF5
MSTSTSAAIGGEAKVDSADEDSAFICNVCLEVSSRDPVVTQCGHLYCWPCLYRWLNTNHTTCPVCKAGVTEENVIPLFIRGSLKDPRVTTASSGSADIPNRPPGHRPEPTNPQFAQTANNIRQMQYGGLSFSIGFGYFPSLFSLQFQNFPVEPQANQPADDQQAHLSRTLSVLCIVVVLALIFF